MKILCDKSQLSDAIAGVSKAVSPRSSIPILEGILLKAEDDVLTLTGYDLEMGITTSFECRVDEPGEVVLSAKLLGDMVRRLDSDEVQLLCEENMTTTIRGNITEFSIMGMNAMDYPEMPDTGADHAVEINAGVLKKMIDSTIYAVSVDDKKPAHTGELFSLDHDSLTIVALDGYRLAICQRPVTSKREIRIVVPQKTMAEVSRLIEDEESTLSIHANRRYIVFSTMQYTITSRLIEGEFLDYNNVLPKEYTTRVTVPVREFINSIERASLMITERLKNPLRVTFGDKVTVRCQTALGKVMDEFDAKLEGNPLEIGFNNRYLLDALRNSGCDEVVLEMTGPLSPVKVLPPEGNDFIYLVLPVRFKND